MVKTAALVTVMLLSSLVLSACKHERHTVMGLTNAQIAPVQATVTK